MTAEITNQMLFDAIADFAVRTEERFEAIDHKFEQIDRRFEAIDHRFDQIDLRIASVEVQMRSVTYELRKINHCLDDHEGRLTAVENDVKDIFFGLSASESTS